jgi:hypothetical protein
MSNDVTTLEQACGHNPSTDREQGPRCVGPHDHPGPHYYGEYDKAVYHLPTKDDVDAQQDEPSIIEPH